MKKLAIAATVLTLGFGAYTLPAFAQADDYGQHAYTQNEPSRFAPGGAASKDWDNSGARDVSRERNRLNNRVDSYHKQY